MADTAIIPVVEKTVDFYGDAIPVAQDTGGEIYVPLTPLSEFLGLNAQAQRRRVGRDPVMAERMRQVVFTAPDGKRYETFAIPLDLLPGWLFGVTTGKVKPDLADKLNRYRVECFRVLWNAFKGDILPAQPPAGDLSGAALALEIATAVQALARQQLEFEAQLQQVSGKQQVMADYMRGFIQRTNDRLATLEVHLSSGATITPAQAAEIALAVKNMGKAYEARGDKQGYPRVYAELYRRYGINSYKALPAAKYEEVIAWLHQWYEEVNQGSSR